MELRKYQVKAIKRAANSLRNGNKAPLLTLPTGAGKTVIFSEIAKRAVQKNNNVLILVHRRELIKQASKKLADIKVPHGIIAAGFKPSSHPIQVASVQTIVRRLNKINYKPALIIIDEAHHSVAGSWKKVLDHFPNAKRIGVTATPCRLSGEGLREMFDDLIIGPNTPAGDHGITIFSGTSGTGNIYFGDTNTSGTGNRMGTISYYHNGNYMRFSTNGNQERLRIDSNGYVTKPNQPSFHARRVNNASSTSNPLVFDDAHHNNGSHYKTSGTDQGKFVAPVAGVYLFYWCAIKTNSGSVCRLYIKKNGSNIYGSMHLRLQESGTYSNGSIQAILNLAAGDKIHISLEAGSIHGSEYTHFGGYLIH